MQTTPLGTLIAFEGIDGAGKTTQVALLERFFHEIAEPVVRSKEPTDGPWGRQIREAAINGRLAVGEELRLFIEDRREHVRDVIGPALADGKTVILDRYFYSTIAYQGVHGADVQSVTRQMVEQFPVPHVVFLIDVPAEMGVDRVANGRGERPNAFEQVADLRRVRDSFLSISRSHHNVVVVDGSRPIEVVRWDILRHLAEGVLMDRHCAKRYGCDDPYMCGERRDGRCRWFQICRAASQFNPHSQPTTDEWSYVPEHTPAKPA